jgi:hypothetical protein
MAYKIFTGAKPFLKADIRPFNVKEMRMLTICVCDLTPELWDSKLKEGVIQCRGVEHE